MRCSTSPTIRRSHLDRRESRLPIGSGREPASHARFVDQRDRRDWLIEIVEEPPTLQRCADGLEVSGVALATAISDSHRRRWGRALIANRLPAAPLGGMLLAATAVTQAARGRSSPDRRAAPDRHPCIQRLEGEPQRHRAGWNPGSTCVKATKLRSSAPRRWGARPPSPFRRRPATRSHCDRPWHGRGRFPAARAINVHYSPGTRESAKIKP